MKETILYGNISIIPNFLKICNNYDVNDISGTQVCFQGYISSSDCDNWSGYYYKKIGKMTSLFPMELFVNKKEGDIISLSINDVQVILTCAQKMSKYNNDTFEYTLYTTSTLFDNILLSNNFHFSHILMVVDIHIKHARFHNFKPLKIKKINKINNK